MQSSQTKFRQTELGEVPENWISSRLDEIIEFDPSRKIRKGDQVKFVAMTDIDAFNKHINNYAVKEFNGGSKFQNYDTLLARITPCLENGKTAFVDILNDNEVAGGSTEFIVMSGKSGQSISEFVYYLATSPEFRDLAIQAMVGTSGRQRVQVDKLKSHEMALPPLPEQQKIAEVLGALDEKIELNRKMNKTLESLAQAIFKKWSASPKGDWKPLPLASVFDFLEGPGIRNWQYSDEGTRFINIRLINNGNIDINSANFINQEDVNNKYQHFLLEEKDMVVSTSGSLGRSAIVRKKHLPLLLNTSVIRFRPKDGVSFPFMYQYLKSDVFLEQQLALASGSAQINFGPIHLNQMEVLFPNQETLDLINQALQPIYDLIINNLDTIETVSQIRDSLLPRLMSGKLRVR